MFFPYLFPTLVMVVILVLDLCMKQFSYMTIIRVTVGGLVFSAHEFVKVHHPSWVLFVAFCCIVLAPWLTAGNLPKIGKSKRETR